MTLLEIQNIANELLDVTHNITTGANKYHSPIFGPVIEGTVRRNYLYLYTVLYLSQANKSVRDLHAGSCFDLSRRTLEDLIALQYMIFKGKEKMAKKFRAFKAIEVKRDIDHLKAAGVIIDPEFEKNVNQDFDRVKEEFKDKSNKRLRKASERVLSKLKELGYTIPADIELILMVDIASTYPDKDQVRKAWAGVSTEQMIDELKENDLFSQRERLMLALAYNKGNYKNHLSPTDVFHHLHNILFEEGNKSDLYLALLLIVGSYTKMFMLFIDEVPVDEKTRQIVENIWKRLQAENLSEHAKK